MPRKRSDAHPTSSSDESDNLVRPLAAIRAREIERARRTVGAGPEDLFLSIQEICQRLSQVPPEVSPSLDEARGLMLLHELREISRALALP